MMRMARREKQGKPQRTFATKINGGCGDIIARDEPALQRVKCPQMIQRAAALAQFKPGRLTRLLAFCNGNLPVLV